MHYSGVLSFLSRYTCITHVTIRYTLHWVKPVWTGGIKRTVYSRLAKACRLEKKLTELVAYIELFGSIGSKHIFCAHDQNASFLSRTSDISLFDIRADVHQERALASSSSSMLTISTTSPQPPSPLVPSTPFSRSSHSPFWESHLQRQRPRQAACNRPTSQLYGA